MLKPSSRRTILRQLATLPLALPAASLWSNRNKSLPNRSPETSASRLKEALNAFSFNDPLLNGSISLEEVMAFCAEIGLYAIDITAYYFKGYPNVPDDEYLYHIKKTAFHYGLDISGTGVRNDFTEPDKTKRRQSVQLVKDWIVAASKMGAPVIRTFAGPQKPEGYTRAQILEWMYDDIHECLEFGKQHGVVVGIQNHNDFIQTADDAIEIVKHINSEWFGLILDTGSYRHGDPYQQIAQSIPYTVNWQIKENIFVDGKEVPTDLNRLIEIIRKSDYRGYLPVETLGAGDPKQKVSALITKLRSALA